MPIEPVLIAGRWREADGRTTFHAENPATGEPLSSEFPVSTWADCDAALTAAAAAMDPLRTIERTAIADFLRRYADRIEARKTELVECAHQETGLPIKPRLLEVELPRTTQQLRLGAAAAEERSWSLPTIDTKLNIRSMLAPIGPVWVFGPNNFPFAFNSVAGGDFVAAIAAGNPVIAKGNTSHPRTTQLLAQEALAASEEAGLPAATVQLLYRTSHEDGERLVADRRTGAIGYTGSRAAGLKLKAAADAAGKPMYAELSSVNPVVILPGVLAERGERLVEEFAGSCLLGSGQFCTNPGLLVLFAGGPTEAFLGQIAQRFAAAPVAPLLSASVLRALVAGVRTWQDAGAKIVVGGEPLPGRGHRFANTLLRVSGAQFLANPAALQTEAFGNASLAVVVTGPTEAREVMAEFEGNLTGCIYSNTSAEDEGLYATLEPLLRTRVGRLLNDKMPTGVAVSPAMNHGGPYPATGHAGFTAVGIPASLRRFAMLQCYDNVRPDRLPPALRNENPTGKTWRLIDGAWTTGNVSS